jgi:hypothetical protein
MRTRRTRTRALDLAIGVGALCAAWSPADVRSQAPVRASLEWRAAPGCAGGSALEAAVSAQLGRAVFSDPGSADVIVTGRAEVEGEALTVVLEMRSREGVPLGVRTLRSTGDCRALDDDIAIVIALMIDLPREQIELFVAAPPAPASDVPPTPDPSPTPPTATDAPIRMAVSASAALALELLPGVHGGARIGAEIDPTGWMPIELALGLWLPVSAERDGSGAIFLAWTVRAGACAIARLPPVDLGGCAAIEAGALHAAGYGLDRRLEPVRPLAALDVLAHLGVYLGDVVELRARVGVMVPFVRDRFVYDTAEGAVPLHRAEVIAPLGELGVAVHFGS